MVLAAPGKVFIHFANSECVGKPRIRLTDPERPRQRRRRTTARSGLFGGGMAMLCRVFTLVLGEKSFSSVFLGFLGFSWFCFSGDFLFWAFLRIRGLLGEYVFFSRLKQIQV